jgi:uncharacterized membrane protein YdjX (TVP38/TMEM64 family)
MALFSPLQRSMTFAKALTYLWIAVVLALVVLVVVEPSRFTGAAIAATIASAGPWAVALFSVLAIVRGALLIPSTPIIVAGGLLFPGALLFVFLVSMAGIVTSAALLYRFPGFAGYDERLASRYPEQLNRLRFHLRKPWAMWFVAGWAFFPAVPTDLICYAAGLVRMPFRRMMAGIIIGEVPLVAAYVFAGSWIAGRL